LKANLPSSTHALLSNKARCFSQSARALNGNFIMIFVKSAEITIMTFCLVFTEGVKNIFTPNENFNKKFTIF